jgi:hypothetical protein
VKHISMGALGSLTTLSTTGEANVAWQPTIRRGRFLLGHSSLFSRYILYNYRPRLELGIYVYLYACMFTCNAFSVSNIFRGSYNFIALY